MHLEMSKCLIGIEGVECLGCYLTNNITKKHQRLRKHGDTKEQFSNSSRKEPSDG